MNPNPTNIIDDLRLLEAPHPIPAIVWLVLGLLIVGAILYRRWRIQALLRQSKVTEIAKVAHEDALAELEKIRKTIATENSRAYAIAVSGIIRRYIENRFDIHAPQRSTEEFLIEAKASPKLDAKYRKALEQFLSSCDFLKFARGLAEVKELEALHDAAVQFVTETRIAPESTSRSQTT